jgi:hypothetical protein
VIAVGLKNSVKFWSEPYFETVFGGRNSHAGPAWRAGAPLLKRSLSAGPPFGVVALRLENGRQPDTITNAAVCGIRVETKVVRLHPPGGLNGHFLAADDLRGNSRCRCKAV